METRPLVPRAEIGMVAAAGAARVREDKHALGIGLERIGLAEIGRAGSGLDDIAVDAAGTALADDTPRASRHLCDQLGPAVGENLVERGGHRRQRRPMFDQPVTTLAGDAGMDALAHLFGDWPEGETAL